MVEPEKKRLKIPILLEDADQQPKQKGCKSPLFPKAQVFDIHKRLRNKCLCLTHLDDIFDTLNKCAIYFSNLKQDCTPKKQEEILVYLSMLVLFFEIYLNQQRKNLVCKRISEVASTKGDILKGILKLLFIFLASKNKFVSYESSKILGFLLLALSESHCKNIILQLLSNICKSKNSLEISHSFDILQTIIEYKEVDVHPLDSYSSSSEISECSLVHVEASDKKEVKSITVTELELKWCAIVQNFTGSFSYSLKNQGVIISFVSLWEHLISIKTNLSVIETKEFYSGLERLFSKLRDNIPLPIWLKVIELFNEVLCYGSTLALQDALAEEPCSLAHLIIRAVKDNQFLNNIPVLIPTLPTSSENIYPCDSAPQIPQCSALSTDNSVCSLFGGNERIILYKTVLLVLKSVAVTVREVRSGSASDSSSHSSCSSSEDVDLKIIEKNLREVLKLLDSFVKLKFSIEADASIAEWIVSVFSDQDDWLVEAMVCALDIYSGIELQMSHSTELQSLVNPHATFASFVESIRLDHDVLIDFLVSNETCFLLYLLRYLKVLVKTWDSFEKQAEKCHLVMTVLIKLRFAIERLVSKDLFPYKINPILNLLEKCEDLYESTSE